MHTVSLSETHSKRIRHTDRARYAGSLGLGSPVLLQSPQIVRILADWRRFATYVPRKDARASRPRLRRLQSWLHVVAFTFPHRSPLSPNPRATRPIALPRAHTGIPFCIVANSTTNLNTVGKMRIFIRKCNHPSWTVMVRCSLGVRVRPPGPDGWSTDMCGHDSSARSKRKPIDNTSLAYFNHPPFGGFSGHDSRDRAERVISCHVTVACQVWCPLSVAEKLDPLGRLAADATTNTVGMPGEKLTQQDLFCFAMQCPELSLTAAAAAAAAAVAAENV